MARLPIEIFHLHADPAEDVLGIIIANAITNGRPEENALSTVKIDIPIRIESASVRKITGVTSPETRIGQGITMAGDVVAISLEVHTFRKVGSQIATHVEPGVGLRSARRKHKSGDDEHQKWRKVSLHCLLLLFSGLVEKDM
ncbi:MAG: hypothetical protein F4X63_05050 [Nitrospira sp. SB0662_bin_26]|nr:hypothetical protein [Nitrospira sp. SB0662_bin_26]